MSSKEIHVKPLSRPISGELRVPGDKSISHRAAIISALSNGRCEIRGFLASDDCLRTVGALRAIGIDSSWPDPDDRTTLEIVGGRGKFAEPECPIDCGNSGTTMRLMAGLLAAQPFRSQLFGDESLSRRPMKRILTPLSQMGAGIRAEGENHSPPLIIDGARLSPITYELPVASAQVKSAILFAGLFATGKTSVIEPAPTRDHTERMLSYYRVRTIRHGASLSIYGGQIPESRDFFVPGDISSASFWAVVAAAQPGALLSLRDVGLNPTRSGVLRVLLRMGAKLSDRGADIDQAEPFGDLNVHGGRLKGTIIEGDEIPNVIDELPALAVAGALAEGTTVIRDAAELRVKESDRIRSVAENLRAMGAKVEERDDGMEITGGEKLRGARLDSFGDHRIAMAFAIAGLFADGETVIEHAGCVDTSYPGFADALKRVAAGRLEGASGRGAAAIYSDEPAAERSEPKAT